MFGLIKTVLLIVLLLFGIASAMTSCEESKTFSDIRSGEAINVEPSFVVLSERQKNFVDAIVQDSLTSREALSSIRALPDDDIASKERKSRAKEKVYADRKTLWRSLTTPLEFEGFSGVVNKIQTSKIALGPRAGMTRLDISVQLYRSGIILKFTQLLDDKNDPAFDDDYPIWNITDKEGAALNWFDLGEGVAVSLSGTFVRYTDKKQWAHCCVSSTAWPSFTTRATQIIVRRG